MAKIFNRAIRLGGEHRVIDSKVVKVLTYDSDNNALLVTGTTAPTGAGYAHGCMFIKTDAGTGVKSLYENQGTSVVADFNLIGEATPGEIALAEGSILVGNASGVGAAVVAKTDTKILVGNGTTITSVAMSGNATMTNAGIISVSGLTIASQAAGDILYFNGTNWVRLAKGTASQTLKMNAGATAPEWVT